MFNVSGRSIAERSNCHKKIGGFVMEELHASQIKACLDAIKAKKVENVYFVACGGSQASLSIGQYWIDQEVDVPGYLYTSNEFIHRKPKRFGKDSIVILKSHSGTTPETVEACKIARSAGALTIGITMEMESPLAKEAECPVHYNYGEKAVAPDTDAALFLTLMFGLINILNPNEKYERIVKGVAQLQNCIDKNKNATKDVAFEFGKRNKREKIIYTMASGEYYYEAYSFTTCLLLEMLWIDSHVIHSGEYFHGPFEITDYDVPFLIIKGMGDSRPLDERAITFAKKFSNNVEVLDVESLDFSMFDKDIAKYYGFHVSSAVIRQYADGLAEYTGHPLSVRRYMWKMDY